MIPHRNFSDLLNEMKEMHEKKGHDYAREGNPFSNFEFAADFSAHFTHPIDRIFASIIGIKIARIIELQNKTAVNESILDTYKDLTIYMGLWWWYKESAQNHPNKMTQDQIQELYNSTMIPPAGFTRGLR